MSLVEMLNIFVVKPSSPPVPSCSLILCQPLPWPALPIGHLNLVRSFVDCDMTHLLGRDACGQRFVVGVPGSPGQMSFMQCEVSVSAASPRGAPGWPASSTWDHGSAQRVVVLGVLRVGPPGRCSSGQRCRVPGAHDRALCPCPSRSVCGTYPPMTPIGTPVASVVDRGSDRLNAGGGRWRTGRLPRLRRTPPVTPVSGVSLGTTLSLVELVALCLAGAGVATTDVVPGAGVLPDCVDVLEGVQPPPLRRCEADLAEP